MNYIDAHMHIADCKEWQLLPDVVQCSSCHTEQEFLFVESLSQKYPNHVFQTFGIHPQNPDVTLFPLLEKLAEEQRLSAVGEAGFDFFTLEFAAMWDMQREVWHLQLELAQRYQLPLVIHCRRAMDKIFLYCKELKKLPAVVFHSFPGSCQEAQNLLQRGIEGYFSLKINDGNGAISENHSKCIPNGSHATEAASIPEQMLPTVFIILVILNLFQ